MFKTILFFTTLTLFSTFTYIKFTSNITSKYDIIANKINNNPNSSWKA